MSQPDYVVDTMLSAKAIAAVHKLPFLAVNHLEAHALTVRLTEGLEFPYLLLLVSGGHCQLLAISGVGAYYRLGTTLDDALGEAFDIGANSHCRGVAVDAGNALGMREGQM